MKKEKTIELLEKTSLGNIKDDLGLSHHTPKERYLESQGKNPNLKKTKYKMLIIEVLAFLLVSFASISTFSSFFKDSPGHYVQPPNGIVEKIEVQR